MIKEITERFGNFNKDSLKERFKDDEEGYENFKEEVIEYWKNEVRDKYRARKISIKEKMSGKEFEHYRYEYIPQYPHFIEFSDDWCSIIEDGLLILEDGHLKDKHPSLSLIEFDIDDRPDENYTEEVITKEEFLDEWNKLPYWHETEVTEIKDDLNSDRFEWEFKDVLLDLTFDETEPIYLEIKDLMEKDLNIKF